MPAFFSLNLTPSVTRDNISIEQGTATLDVQYNVTKGFDIAATANATISTVITNQRGFDLAAFNNVSLTCDAVATKRLVQFLPALTDLISDGGAVRTTGSNVNCISDLTFLGGRLVDNIVNARYNRVGYVTEGYAADEPAAKAFATLRIESDITILLDVNVVSTLEVSARVDYDLTLNLASQATLTCGITGLQLIELNALGNASLAIDYIRRRDNAAVLNVEANLYANADYLADTIQLIASAATLDVTVAKILGNIQIGNLATVFTLNCIGDDLILDEAEVSVQVNSTLTVQLNLRQFGVANLVARAATLTVGTVEHINEFIYVIPAEGWQYKIQSESRNFVINQESGIRAIDAESRIKVVNSESRVNIIRR